MKEVGVTTIDSFIIRIDSLSLPYSNTIQYYSDSLKNYLTYFNQGTNSIYFINYESKQTEFVWNKSRSVQSYDSYFLVNSDSIFLFNTKKKLLDRYNLDGEHISRYDFKYDMIQDSTILPFPYLTTSLPLIVNKDNLYLSGYHVGEFGEMPFHRKTIIRYNDSENKINFLVDYPAIYNSYNWGITYYYITSVCFNSNKNLIIVNFPLSHELYVYDLIKEEGSYLYASSKHIKAIEPFSRDKNDFIDSKDRLKYYLTNASYSSVFYDKYKNIYYRIAALPMEDKDILNRDFWKKRKYTVIFLNERFEYLGERFLGGILPENIFINENG
ncbi:MAG TPA: DUF4221 family protein, partial [Draconibacterium sp.]|nr:DUF4221 family protein [Draconibacterium sp.]